MRKRCAKESLEGYRIFLRSRDMKPNTVDKYIRDIRKFLVFIREDRLDHDAVVRYREYLLSRYKDTSVNSMLAALNGYLKYIGRKECCVRLLKIQRQLFLDESRELTREEYQLLVWQADRQGDRRLSCILQTIGSSGIRVSELSAITVESLGQKTVCINSKGKIRHILLPASLVELLKEYCRQEKRISGSIFVTRSGRPVDRRNVWSGMKALCRNAGVNESKVFPHNLRHLFARCFYEKEKDIVRLADYLGHSSVETTRRYTITSQIEECRKTLEMGLLSARMAMGQEAERLPSVQVKAEQGVWLAGTGQMAPGQEVGLMGAGIPATQKSGYPAVQASGQAATQKSGYPAVQAAGQAATQKSGYSAVQAAGQAAMQKSGYPTVQAAGQAATQKSGYPAVRTSGQAAVQMSGQDGGQSWSWEAGERAGQRAGQGAGKKNGQISRKSGGRRRKSKKKKALR